VAHWVSHFHLFVLPMLFPYLKAQLGTGYIELGFALTVSGLVSGLTQAPIGYLADHIGARKVLLIGSRLGGLALIVLGLHLSYTSLIVCAALLGLANSVYHPCDLRDSCPRIWMQANGPRVFDPHLRRLPRRRGGARDHGSPGGTIGGLGALIVAGAVGPCRGAAADRCRHSRCEFRRPQGRWPGNPEAKYHHAGDHHADVLLHAARPVECRHRQFRRGRADDRLWRDLLGRQHRADRVSRRRAAGVLAGGYLADRTTRHGQVAAACFGVNAVIMLVIATTGLPPLVLTTA
jgi:hypothetical protein